MATTVSRFVPKVGLSPAIPGEPIPKVMMSHTPRPPYPEPWAPPGLRKASAGYYKALSKWEQKCREWKHAVEFIVGDLSFHQWFDYAIITWNDSKRMATFAFYIENHSLLPEDQQLGVAKVIKYRDFEHLEQVAREIESARVSVKEYLECKN